MEKIVKVPIITLGDSIRNSFESFSFMIVDNIRTISRINHRFHDELDVRSYVRIQYNSGNSITVNLPLEECMRLFKCNFLQINGDNYAPLKNIVAFSNFHRTEWTVDTIKDRWSFRNDNIHIFNGDTTVRYNIDDAMVLWEKEISNRPIIKNLKIASGGNV